MSNLKRSQIVLLVFLFGLVVIRLLSGPPSLPGSITLSDLEIHELAQQHFQVSESLRVVIDAVGSIDERQEAGGFAAYPWITQWSTGEVVWSMNAHNTSQNGSLVQVDQDELTLDPGMYILNFATYGQGQHRARLPFRKDRRKWKAVVYSFENENGLRPIIRPMEISSDALIWKAAPLSGDEKKEYLFEVLDPIELNIYAIGQLGNQEEAQPVDYSRIEDALTGEVVWQFSRDNTTWAGGIQENRIFHGERMINPGIYRTVDVTNHRHHYNSWVGNPPFNPRGWGLHLSTSDHEGVKKFDPWKQRRPLIKFDRVEDDEEHSSSFTISEPISVVFYALGEITGPGNGYDLAWLEQHQSNGRSRTLWEMSWEGSIHAGGHRKNRKEVKFLRLVPGNYTLHYESDGSHSYEDWNSDKPDYPERWGVAMFPVQISVTPKDVIVDVEPLDTFLLEHRE